MEPAPAYSVLRNITRADIRRDPYPHIVVENCLPPEIYVIHQNHRYDLRAHRILRHPHSVSPAWEDFVRYHVSHDFFREFLDLLGPDIASIYPTLESRLGRTMNEW